MKHISNLSLFVLLLGVVASCGRPTPITPINPPTLTSELLEKISTGFYWPTGTSQLGNYSGWLSSGCSGSAGYDQGLYHIGKDIEAAEGDNVYAITDGTVFYISKGGWGEGNIGVLVEHKLDDGISFTAVYGHIRTNITEGDTVQGGKPFATIGPYYNGSKYVPHLHLGIRPGTSTKDPYGRMPCPVEGQGSDTNGFVDPIAWITTRTPLANSGEPVAAVTPLPGATRTPPAPAPTPARPVVTSTSTSDSSINLNVTPPAEGFFLVDQGVPIEMIKLPFCGFYCSAEQKQQELAAMATGAPSTNNPTSKILFKSSSVSVASLFLIKYLANAGVGVTSNSAVYEVLPFSGALEAGVQVGDIILKINGIEVKGNEAALDPQLQGEYGSQVELQLLRGTSTISVTVIRKVFVIGEPVQFDYNVKTDYVEVVPKVPWQLGLYCFLPFGSDGMYCFRVHQ